MPVTLAINVDTGGWKLGGLHVMFRDGMKVLGVRRIQVEGRLILLESRVPPTLGLYAREWFPCGGQRVMPCPALKRHAAGTGKGH